MNIAIFGATGSLGGECVRQCLERGHQLTALARTPSRLPGEVRDRLSVVGGDGLDADRVGQTLSKGAEAALFAIGIDRHSPENLCTDVTRNIVAAMRERGVRRLVWCGGGSTRVPEDRVTPGSRFVGAFASTFMGLRHRDKAHQLELLEQSKDLEWLGVRPLQMRRGPMRGEYRLGFHPYSGLSRISFADCAHAMIGMLDDDSWLHQAPIVQY